jgi:hypothetical protein
MQEASSTSQYLGSEHHGSTVAAGSTCKEMSSDTFGRFLAESSLDLSNQSNLPSFDWDLEREVLFFLIL